MLWMQPYRLFSQDVGKLSVLFLLAGRVVECLPATAHALPQRLVGIHRVAVVK